MRTGLGAAVGSFLSGLSAGLREGGAPLELQQPASKGAAVTTPATATAPRARGGWLERYARRTPAERAPGGWEQGQDKC
jgi:hypothetical protein